MISELKNDWFLGKCVGFSSVRWIFHKKKPTNIQNLTCYDAETLFYHIYNCCQLFSIFNSPIFDFFIVPEYTLIMLILFVYTSAIL